MDQLNLNQEQQPASSKKWVVGVLIIIGFLLIIGAGVWYVLSQKEKVVVDEQVVAGDQSEKNSDEMRDWKTYKNEEYGFSFKYPNSFIQESVDQNSTNKEFIFNALEKSGDFRAVFLEIIHKPVLPLAEYIAGIEGDKVQTIRIGDRNGYISAWSDMGVSVKTVFVGIDTNTTLAVKFYDFKEISLRTLILSTFKFITP